MRRWGYDNYDLCIYMIYPFPFYGSRSWAGTVGVLVLFLFTT